MEAYFAQTFDQSQPNFVDLCKFTSISAQKKTHPGFPGHVSYGLLSFFNDSRVSQQGASVSELPAALRRPQKKHAPGFWNMYFLDFVIFKRF